MSFSLCLSLSKKQYSIFMLRAAARIQSNLLCKIHKFREHVSRNLYKGRKNVPVGRGFSSVFARKRGFEREAARKTLVFRQPQTAVQSYSGLSIVYLTCGVLEKIAASHAASPGVAGVLHKHGFSDHTERADEFFLVMIISLL